MQFVEVLRIRNSINFWNYSLFQNSLVWQSIWASSIKAHHTKNSRSIERYLKFIHPNIFVEVYVDFFEKALIFDDDDEIKVWTIHQSEFLQNEFFIYCDLEDLSLFSFELSLNQENKVV